MTTRTPQGWTSDRLTTRQAAALLGVSVSTVKRWADEGLLACEYTPGGHRRIRRAAVEELQRAAARSHHTEQPRAHGAGRDGGDRGPLSGSVDSVDSGVLGDYWASSSNDDPWRRWVRAWLRRLQTPAPTEPVVAALYRERERLGSWVRVAEALGDVLRAIGWEWERGAWTVIQEHVASEQLRAAIWRVGDELLAARAPTEPEPLPPAGPPGAMLERGRASGDAPDGPGAEAAAPPRALLATATGEDHDVGLALVRMVLHAEGWCCVWAGRRSPVDALLERVGEGDIAAVALSASIAALDDVGLAAEVEAVAAACAAQGVPVWMGGHGRWPDPPPVGAARLRTFSELAVAARDARSRRRG